MSVRATQALSDQKRPLRAAKQARLKAIELRVIPAKGDLLSLGRPTISAQGMSLSQALEEQREERL